MYEVKDVVCDYGLYENGELKLICNSYRNALLIKDILEKDDNCKNMRTDYYYKLEDAEKFFGNYEKGCKEENNIDTINRVFQSVKGYIIFRKGMTGDNLRAKCILDDCVYLLEHGYSEKLLEVFKECKKEFGSSFEFEIVRLFMGSNYYATLMDYWNEA